MLNKADLALHVICISAVQSFHSKAGAPWLAPFSGPLPFLLLLTISLFSLSVILCTHLASIISPKIGLGNHPSIHPRCISQMPGMLAGEESPEEEDQPNTHEARAEEQNKLRELSSDHRTGLAKLPNVVEWLINKLGHGRDGAPGRSVATSDFCINLSHRLMTIRAETICMGQQGRVPSGIDTCAHNKVHINSSPSCLLCEWYSHLHLDDYSVCIS